MSATFIFRGREPGAGELPIPQHPVFESLDSWIEQGYLLIPGAEKGAPLGIPPQNAAHFSRRDELIKEGDRPPIQACNNPFRTIFLATVNYPSYYEGFPHHSGIRPLREETGDIVGYDCFMSEKLKEHLLRRRLQTAVFCVDGTGFAPKEPEGQGNTYYAEADTPLKILAALAVDLSVLGPALLDKADDPITDRKIRGYLKQLGVRTSDIMAYETSHDEEAQE
ncbi:MAG: hypothetical protein AAB834_00380 [Patescibacteria group bacterium]